MMSGMNAENEYTVPQAVPKRLQLIIDVVFAITMVAFAIVYPWPKVDSTVANPLMHMLSKEAVNFVSLALTYGIVAMYWYKHTVQFRYLKRINGGQVALQLIYTFGIIILPLTVWLTLAMTVLKLTGMITVSYFSCFGVWLVIQATGLFAVY